MALLRALAVAALRISGHGLDDPGCTAVRRSRGSVCLGG